ncbi:hypothetical protein [Limnoglobus roseus]|nr:hypothetical protein [Limnoglobus roseus]
MSFAESNETVVGAVFLAQSALYSAQHLRELIAKKSLHATLEQQHIELVTRLMALTTALTNCDSKLTTHLSALRRAAVPIEDIVACGVSHHHAASAHEAAVGTSSEARLVCLMSSCRNAEMFVNYPGFKEIRKTSIKSQADNVLRQTWMEFHDNAPDEYIAELTARLSRLLPLVKRESAAAFAETRIAASIENSDSGGIKIQAKSVSMGGSKGKNVNAQVYDLVMKKPAAKGWTCQQIAEEIGCHHSSVVRTKAWKQIAALQETAKRDAIDRQSDKGQR